MKRIIILSIIAVLAALIPATGASAAKCNVSIMITKVVVKHGMETGVKGTITYNDCSKQNVVLTPVGGKYPPSTKGVPANVIQEPHPILTLGWGKVTLKGVKGEWTFFVPSTPAEKP
jgi:hypothetical protein